MKKWEYKFWYSATDSKANDGIEESLNRFGQEGWEVILISETNFNYMVIFKRPIIVL